MEIVFIVLIVVGVLYFNKVIKAVLSLAEDSVETGARMSKRELIQVEADQVVRHRVNDSKRTLKVEAVEKNAKKTVSASEIVEMYS